MMMMILQVKEALPEWACPAFKHFERLNAVQSKVGMTLC